VDPFAFRGTVRLATFLHISDLHFGDVDPHSQHKDAATDPLIASLASNTGPVWDGLLGHSYGSLVRLEKLHAKLQAEENSSLIVTGDLTAYGAESQFATATEFLGGLLWPPTVATHIGLRQKSWKLTSIPGNHDHWCGKPVIFGRPTSALSRHFPTLPSTSQYPLKSGQFLNFLRIDSDADVNPYFSNRFFARGCFTSQLDSLSAKLPVPQETEIRVLLVHHSYSISGPALAMTPLSKAALNDFIVDHKISVVLCGHIHQPPFFSPVNATHLKRTQPFLEARSGTTTQISTLPLRWKNLFRNRPARPRHWPNSLLIHRLYYQPDGSIEWVVNVHLENSTEFAAVSTLPDASPGSIRFRVWP
jgi:3',5'-cyclic AMP phosphodiesterase CpdA